MSIERNLLDKINEIKKQNTSDDNAKITEIDKITISDVTPLSAKSLVKNIDDKDKDEWIKLRTEYANKIFILLCAEIIGLFILLILIGLKYLEIDNITMDITIMFVISQSFLLVREIVSNLFKKNT